MISTSAVKRNRPPSRRAGFSYRGLIVALVVLIVVPAIAWSFRSEFSWTTKATGPMLHEVQRKDFIHEVTERGTVQSASNVEVRCAVKSRNMSGTQILFIVPEGTYVTPVPDWQPKDPDQPEDPPDLLVKLDSSALEAQMTQQEITCANSEAAVTQAQNVFDTATISLEEYLNGSYVEKKQELEAAKAVAEENLARAKEYLDYSNQLYAKGYVSERELQANTFDVKKKDLDLEKAKTALAVLEKYTLPKTREQLNADIRTAKARLQAAQHSYELDNVELTEIQTQIANCTIRAPEPGQVVYANITDRRGGNETIIEEGSLVRERQVIIKLPDPKRMQVEAKVNEAKITLVKPGAPALIRLDAFADLELKGEVEKVNKYPAPSSWFTANVKEYDTIVRILGDDDNSDNSDSDNTDNDSAEDSTQEDSTQEDTTENNNEETTTKDVTAEDEDATAEDEDVTAEDEDVTAEDATAEDGEPAKPDGNEQAPKETEPNDGNESLTELRPGMTAEVKIRVEEFSNVLQIPVQALIEHGGKHYCILPGGKGFQSREVVIGSTNDKVVVIHEGLAEGEKIVLNAAAYRDQADLPEIPPEAAAFSGNSPDGAAKPKAGAKSSGDTGASGKSEAAGKTGAAGKSEATGKSGAAGESAGTDRVGMMLSRFDANGNGQLELDELPEQMRAGIAQADANGDKVLDRKELAAAATKMPAGGRRGAGGGPGGARPPGGGRGPAGGRPGGAP